MPSFYQFVLGSVNMFNFTKNLNDMKKFGKVLKRWASSILGGAVRTNGKKYL